MSDMFPDTPMDWDTTAEKPWQDSSVPPKVKTFEDKQGQGAHISLFSGQDRSRRVPKGRVPPSPSLNCLRMSLGRLVVIPACRLAWGCSLDRLTILNN